MSGRSLVSVIMPFLNAAAYLDEAVASVVAQTHADWELLLVNDGSSDGGDRIARGRAAADPARVRYFEHPQRGTLGASASRNLGLAHARGEYIAFLDADDVYLPTKLEAQVAILERHREAGATYGATERWYSWTGRTEDRQRDEVPDLGVATDTIYAPPHLLLRFLTKAAPVPCTCSLLVRRGAALGAGGFETSFRQIYTDQAFYTKLFLTTAVYVSSGCWDRYRQHSDSCCTRVKAAGQSAAARHAYLRWVQGYFRDQRVRDSRLSETVTSELWRYEHPRTAGIMTRIRRTRADTTRRVRGYLQAWRERRSAESA